MGRAKRSHKIRCPKEYISTLRSALIGTGPSSPLRRRPPRCAAACRVAPVPRDIPCALPARGCSRAGRLPSRGPVRRFDLTPPTVVLRACSPAQMRAAGTAM